MNEDAQKEMEEGDAQKIKNLSRSSYDLALPGFKSDGYLNLVKGTLPLLGVGTALRKHPGLWRV